MKKAETGLTVAEEGLLRRITRDLQTRRTFEQTPQELLIDYVRLNSRIERLHDMIDRLEDDPKVQLGAMRQLEAAVTQRRQLANSLFPREEVGKKTLRHIAANEGASGTEWSDVLQ